MKKGLFEYCQKHLGTGQQFKVSASFKQLVERYNIGYIVDKIYYFSEKDRQSLLELVAMEHDGIHLFRDPYPDLQTRTQTAKIQRNEKVGALKVSEDFILLNSLDALRLNKQTTLISPLSSLGHYVCASEIESIEHQLIVLVENLIIMANLRHLILPDPLKNALWVYRGDVKQQQNSATAYAFFKRFQESNQLICFSDFDPAGLKIALTCGAKQWLTLADANDINIALFGHEQEWFAQTLERAYLHDRAPLSAELTALLSTMNIHQKTLKQEHMLAQGLKLALYPLPQ